MEINNFRFYFILSLIFEIIANQKTGVSHWINEGISLLFACIALFFAFKK